MITDLKNCIDKIVNPLSGKPESVEKRVESISEKDGEVHIKYNREGLSPEEKRKFEDNILKSIKDKIDPEKVLFSSFSKDSSDIYKKCIQRCKKCK